MILVSPKIYQIYGVLRWFSDVFSSYSIRFEQGGCVTFVIDALMSVNPPAAVARHFMSSFTPDDQLDLLFAPELISNEVKVQLGADLHMRPLAKTDHTRSHLSVLSILTSTPPVSPNDYVAAFEALRGCSNTYYTLVIINKSSDQIVGVGCVFVEQKFIRGLGKVGHIEDIAVDKSMQGRKLGLRIIQALTGISEKAGCYKTILNCSDSNIPFYEKCGFAKKENEMALYHNKESTTQTATATSSSVPTANNERPLTPRL